MHEVLAGDADAGRRVVEALSGLPRMLRSSDAKLGTLRTCHDLDDAVQQVLLELWLKLERYDGRVPLRQWAFGFATMELRRMRRRCRRVFDREPIADDPIAAPSCPAVDAERIEHELRHLTPQVERVVRLKGLDGLTFEEIAERLAISSNTAKTRYYRGIEALRARLSGTSL